MKRLPDVQETLDFNAPLFLDSHGKVRADATFEHQRTIRIYKGKWAGSHAYSDQLQSAVAAPYSLWNDAIRGSVAAGYGFSSYGIKAENINDGISVSATERFDSRKAGLFLKVLEKGSLGVALLDTDYRERPEIPIEINIAPFEHISIAYKRSYTDIAGNFTVLLSGSSGAVPVSYAEDKNELSVKAEYKGILLAEYAQEIKHPENSRSTGRIQLPGSLYLVGDYSKRRFDFDQDFSVNELAAGYLKGEGRWREYRIGAGVDINRKWNIEANYRRQNISSSGGGIANSSAIVNFWPSLLVGKYNHLYSVELDSDQYHLGAEYKGQNASFSIGCQYIDIRPTAELTYWRSLLLGLGRSGQETHSLETDRIKLLFLSLGTGYRWDKFDVSFAFGQIIPLGSHKRSGALKADTPSGAGAGTNEDIFSRIGDYINRNPGGNMLRFKASFIF